MGMAMLTAMGKSRVTAKYQITLPADVRERVPIRPGETVEVVAKDDQTVLVRRTGKVKNPLKYLIAKKPWLDRSIPPEQVDELAEEP